MRLRNRQKKADEWARGVLAAALGTDEEGRVTIPGPVKPFTQTIEGVGGIEAPAFPQYADQTVEGVTNE